MSDSGIDSRLARKRFERAAGSYAGASRLETEVAGRMMERLDYVKLAPGRVLDAGCGPGRDLAPLARRYAQANVIGLDFSPAMLRAGRRWTDFFRRKRAQVCGDLARLPLAHGSIGLAWSNMALHWAGDAPAALRELHRVLEVGGLLMFSTLGPDTLAELRAAAGETRVHRFADMHDIGDWLVGAGFADPVMDMERLTVAYDGAEALLSDLRESGQTAAPRAEPRTARGLSGKGFLASLGERLDVRRREGKLHVSFEVLYGHAWKAAPKRTADGRNIVRFS